ncbi:MAG: hypothetical protein NC341_10115 [Blautia sp.]|nr:hypothetical protein [Blautia sp.]MCM1201961.1 hypothetical protein [Bacteroides fragilis]
MDERIQMWLDGELKEFSGDFKKFNEKVTKMLYLWMVISVVGMTALGFLVGGDAASVMKLHFPIGCAIALIIWICLLFQNKKASDKKVRPAYEKAIAAAFRSEDDKAAFVRQIESGSFGKITFMNTVVDKYPCRFMAGSEYLMYNRNLGCRFIKVGDIDDIYCKEEKSKIRYNLGDYRVMQNLTMGISLVIEYKNGSASEKKNEQDSLYLENGRQAEEVFNLIRKYCPGLDV